MDIGIEPQQAKRTSPRGAHGLRTLTPFLLLALGVQGRSSMSLVESVTSHRNKGLHNIDSACTESHLAWRELLFLLSPTARGLSTALTAQRLS